MMKLYSKDPNCEECVSQSKVELVEGEPVVILVHVALGANFPPEEQSVTEATFKYGDGPHSAVESLGPENGGPEWPDWTPGSTFVVTLEGESWLTPADFETLLARMDVTTSDGGSWQEWKGIE